MGRKKSQVRQVDGKGRVTLLSGFADCTVILEQTDANTIVVRKASVVPLDDGLAEVLKKKPRRKNRIKLSEADAEAFENALANPPAPNESLKKLMRKR